MTPISPEDNPSTALPSYGLRLAASLIDFLVINIFQIPLIVLFAFLQVNGINALDSTLAFAIILVIAMIWYLSYFSSNGRQTLGYRLTGIVAVRSKPPESGEITSHISFGRALWRTIWELGFSIFWLNIITYIPVAVTSRKQAVQDMISGIEMRRASGYNIPMIVATFIGALVVMVAGIKALIIPFVMQYFSMPSGSMTPAIPINSTFMSNHIYYKIKPLHDGDIVTFHLEQPQFKYMPAGGDVNMVFVKRIVALPGEELKIVDSHVFKRGAAGPEPGPNIARVDNMGYHSYDLPSTNQPFPDFWTGSPNCIVTESDGEWIKVPPGEVMVLGDDRNSSDDSHIWGFLPVNNINGRVMFLVSPVFKDV